MEFKGLPIGRREIDIIIESCPVWVAKNKIGVGYLGYNPKNETSSSLYYIDVRKLHISKLPKTLKIMIDKISKARFRRVK